MTHLQKIFFFLFLLSLQGIAQPGNNHGEQHSRIIDSLKKGLLTVKEDTSKVNLLNKLVQELYRSDLSLSEKYARDALRLSYQEKFRKGIAESFFSIGMIYAFQLEHDSSIYYFDKAEDLFKKNNDMEQVGIIQYQKGILYVYKGEYDKSLSYFLDALRIAEEIGNNSNAANAFIGIGNVYGRLGQNDKHIIYLEKALEIKKKLNDSYGIGVVLNNIGIVYLRKGDNEGALKKFEQSFEMIQKTHDRKMINNVLGNLAVVNANLKRFDKSIEYYFMSLRYQQEIGDKQAIAATYGNIGTTYYDMGKFAEAIKALDTSILLAKAIGEKETMKNSYQSLSEIYASLKDYKNAYLKIQLYTQIKDSIFNEESSKQIAEMQTKYETEKKEQQIALLNKDKEIQQAAISRQQTIIWFVAAGLLIVTLFSAFIIKERRKSEKLLLNILPAETAKELKAKGKATAKHYQSVTVMFTDFKGFTQIAEKLSAEELVNELDLIFRKFDEIISKYKIEKIKTIGDAYMCASGLPVPNTNHAEEMVNAALEIQQWMKENEAGKWNIRIGVHSGPVTAGVVGDKKFAYDIWGDTVNTASRMESSGEAGKVNISGATYELIKDKFTCAFRGKILAKNKGEIEMYFVEQNT